MAPCQSLSPSRPMPQLEYRYSRIASRAACRACHTVGSQALRTCHTVGSQALQICHTVGSRALRNCNDAAPRALFSVRFGTRASRIVR
eukprot:6481167-Pyramimonas_sp.AAC.1